MNTPKRRSESTLAGESAHARRLQIRVERIARCAEVYDIEFRNAVAKAWKLYQEGGPIVRRKCGLGSLIKKADKIWEHAKDSLAERANRHIKKSDALPNPDRYDSPLVRFKGTSKLGVFKLISKPKDGCLEELACFLSQEPIPLSLLECAEEGCTDCLIHHDGGVAMAKTKRNPNLMVFPTPAEAAKRFDSDFTDEERRLSTLLERSFLLNRVPHPNLVKLADWKRGRRPRLQRADYVVFKDAPHLGTFKIIGDVKEGGLVNLLSDTAAPIHVDTLERSRWK